MKLEQKTGLLGQKLKLSIKDNDTLVLTHKRFMNSSDVKYLLDDIDPKYDIYKEFSIAAAITSLIALLFALFLAWQGTTVSAPEDGPYYFFSFLLVGAAAVAGMKAFNSRVNVIAFNAIDGRHLFSIFANRPDEATVQNFSDNLAKVIQKIRYSDDVSIERRSEMLLKHVEFLLEENVLNSSEATSAMKRITANNKAPVVKLAIA